MDAWSDHAGFSPGLGYDFVALIYENEPGAPRRETMVRVWRKTGDEWKIIRMSNVLGRISVEGSGAEEE